MWFNFPQISTFSSSPPVQGLIQQTVTTLKYIWQPLKLNKFLLLYRDTTVNRFRLLQFPLVCPIRSILKQENKVPNDTTNHNSIIGKMIKFLSPVFTTTLKHKYSILNILHSFLMNYTVQIVLYYTVIFSILQFYTVFN